MVTKKKISNYEVIKTKMTNNEDEYQLLRRGIISIQIFSFVKRYERYLLYRQVFNKTESQRLTAVDMRCDVRTIRRAVAWCKEEI